MTSLPPYDGPKLVRLLDGTLVFNDSEPWRHLCEARDLARQPMHERDSRLFDIERIRGVEEAARLRQTINEVIAVTAGEA